MKKNIFRFNVFFLFNIILFLFSGQLYAATENFCSDIKIPMIKDGDFDRCEAQQDCNESSSEQCCQAKLWFKNGNEWKGGSEVYLSYTASIDTTTLAEGQECNEGTQKIDIQNTNGTQKTEKIVIIKKGLGNKCITITKTPVIFQAVNISVYDASTGTNKIIEKAPKPAIFGNSLNDIKNGTCKLKSCLDLTIEEFEAIDYSKNFFSDKNGKFVFPPVENGKDSDGILFYKFCDPKKPNGEDIYCHDFTNENENVLQYLWPYATAYDGSNNYHCILHQCPIKEGLSLSCDTNYLNFIDKSPSYIKKYKTYIAKIEETDDLKTADCVAIDYTENENCLQPRFSVSLKCTDNSQCDEYIGLDRNITKVGNKILSEGNNKSKIVELLHLTSGNSCIAGKCIKTYDCSLTNEYNEFCNNLEENQLSELDEEMSYFYRPVPPSPATEVCPGNNQDPILQQNTCEEGRVIIKRTLRGTNDYPLEPNKDITLVSKWIYQKEDGSRICGINQCDKNEEGNDCKDTDEPCGVKNYFENKYKRVCAETAVDFKNFENYVYYLRPINYHYGKYYNGSSASSKKGNLPHILPLCNDEQRLGVYGRGREYMCENDGNQCNTPSWDSYYIKGTPTYIWKDSDAHIQTVTLTACLRQKNTGELAVCGERECRVDCAFGVCATQWCGIDRCVQLTTELKKQCPIVPTDVEKKDSKDFMANYENCAKEVSNNPFTLSSVRFRLQALDRNAYVFLDVTSLGCNSLNKTRRRGGHVEDGKYTYAAPSVVRYNVPALDKNTIGGTFEDGILDGYELYDDNSLTDNNCDGIINDKDIFGEYLYQDWNCDILTQYEQTKDDSAMQLESIQSIPSNEWCNETLNTRKSMKQYNSNCKAMRISGSDNIGGIFEDTYIPLDIVQYQGNNQNIDKFKNKESPRNFCKVGQLDRCRGYFDKDNNFIKEQQAVVLPMPIGPDFFYKHATYENVPDLFLPILNIYKAGIADNSIYISLNLVNDSNSLFLNFFDPSIGIQYGDQLEHTKYEFCTTNSGDCTCLYKKTGCDCSKDYCARPINNNNLNSDIVTIPFQNANVIGKVKTKYGKNKDAETFYIFKKTAYLNPEPAARVCLYQILVNDKERLIRCLNRANPLISNFFIQPNEVDIEKPTVKAYFYNRVYCNTLSDDCVCLNGKTDCNCDRDLCVKPINLNSSESSIKFYKNTNTSHKEEDHDDVLVESSYAYGQGYPIYLEKSYCSKLYYDCIFYKNEYKAKVNNPQISDEEKADLRNKVNMCDVNIDLYCKHQNGNENLVLKTTKDDNNNITTNLIKVKENPNAIGGYNQICVTKGFEKDKTYQLVLSTPPRDGVLGKCILTNESKKNANCRKKFYYEYCAQSNQDGCVCLNGDQTCNCSNNSCVKRIDCSCSSEQACINLPEGCYVSGFNANNSVLSNDGNLTDACKCQVYTSNTNNTTRPPTPRELGLCVDLIDLHFCESIKYYDENRIYYNDGDGKYKQDVGKSNIWRTSQKQLGKTYMGNFGHAEFDKANDCSGFSNKFCNLTTECYFNSSSPFKGQVCREGEANCECVKVQKGTCNGFWNYKNNTVPLAKCGPQMNGNNIFTDANGEAYYIFELIPNTGCERYFCPTILDASAITNDEKLESDGATETSVSTINTEGKSNGFAAWGKYQKGTYAIPDGDEENAYGDDLEQREAEHCLQGYGPAGSNFAIKEYIPLSAGNVSNNNITINSSLYTDNNINKNEILDNIVKNMIGYNLYVNNKTSSIDQKIYTSDENIDISDDKKLNNYNRFKDKMRYSAKDHLPVRYCSQLGNWMSVDDIYNKFYDKYKIDPYYTTNSAFHKSNLPNDGLTSDGFVKKVAGEQDTNTYGNTIQYGKRYCERLFCQAINGDDIGLLSVEASEPKEYLKYDDLSDDIKYDIAYPNVGNLNYPRIVNNPDDNRTNSVYNNRYTFWRHAGGATWAETPASRKDITINDACQNNNGINCITGTCAENKKFYPYDTEFLSNDENISSFDMQHASLFSPNDSNETADLKTNSLKAPASPATQPKRVCSRWGIWSNIENECVATCEPLDPFRTGFKDENRYEKSDGSIENKPDGLLQNYEITELYRDPKYRSNYFRLVGNVKYGDIYTGGAKWGRTKAGEVAIGECDARVGPAKKDSVEYLKRKQNNFPDALNESGIQFLRTGNSSLKSLNITGYHGEIKTHNNINTKGRPYRACLPDGTWGPVQDPCVNFRTCPDDGITTESVLKSGQFQVKNNKEDIQAIATLSGGSINYEYANSNSGIFEIPLEVSCNSNSNISFESGTIRNTCNITTGEWVENAAITNCALKTCAGGQYNLTYNNSFTINNGEYYPKKSGYKGAITINKSGNSKSYLGYEFSKPCPDNYTCNNCSSNQVNYTCDFDNNNNLNWIKTGTCEPKTCNLVNLQNLCDGKAGCNKPSSLQIRRESSTVFYDDGESIKGNNATVGTEVYLSCKSGYSGDISATCGTNGTWTYNGSCQEVKCPSFNKTISNGTYNLSNNGACADGTSSNVCPGAKYVLSSCNTGYTKDGDKTWTCGNDGNWKEEGNGWCGKNCTIPKITYTVYGCSAGNNDDYNINCVFDNFNLSHNSSENKYAHGCITQPAGYTNDLAMCRLQVSCYNGQITYATGSNADYFKNSPVWEKGEECETIKNNGQVTSLCCNQKSAGSGYCFD